MYEKIIVAVMLTRTRFRRYAPRGRALCAALKRNADLRSRLVARELGAAAFVALADDPAALARGSAAGEERERLKAKALAKATVDSAKAAHRCAEIVASSCKSVTGHSAVFASQNVTLLVITQSMDLNCVEYPYHVFTT